MTKDELKREAFEWTEKNISTGISMYNPSIEMYCAKAYEDSAEPREKQIEKLEKENIYYKDIIETNTAEWEEQGQRVVILEKENAELRDEIHTWKEASSANSYKAFQLQEENKNLINIKNIHIGGLLKAKEIILKLYNAGRDTLMCPTEEAFNRLSDAINDRGIEQFLQEVEK